MRHIKFGRSLTFDQTEVLEDVKLVAMPQLEIISKNISEVMIVAGEIEKRFGFFVLGYFMPKINRKQKIFQEQILNSSSFNFNLKRNVVISMIRENNLLEGSDLSDFEKISSKVIKYRNALAHGSIIYRDREMNLEYYEGQKRIKILNDNYWDLVEDTYKNMQDKLKLLTPMFEKLRQQDNA